VVTNGDIVVGDISGVLRRFSVPGVDVWSTPPNLGSAVEGPLVLAAGDAELLVPAGGKLFALGSDGSKIWSGTLDSGSVRAANIFTPPGQTSNIMSTAYLASSSGKLFAVIVDGELDASAPWPKAFHDPRNTNRAGPQP
jgi:outer membrane protein assembly factor BamB